MVDVVQWAPEQVRSWSDRLLPRLLVSWEELPDIVAEIDDWDDGEAMDYIVEWPLHEDQRHILEHFAAERSVLTADQQNQLCRLRELVDQHRPLLDRLLGS